MKRISRQLMMALSVMFIMLVISGCGSSLQKPTGLENEEQPIAEAVYNVSQDVIEDKAQDEETMPETIVKEETADKEEVSGEQSETSAISKQESEREEKKSESIVKSESTSIKKPETNEQPTKSADTAKSPVVASKPANESPKTTPASQPEKVKPVPPNSELAKPATLEPNKPDLEAESKVSTIVYSIVISSSEIPLPPTMMGITEGDTVLQALIDITKEKKIQMDYRGGRGATAYIEGIQNVYEFDRGQGSGWMYRVNGIFPDRGAGVVKLLDGDRIEWLYTTNLGEDLNADLKPFRR